MTIYVLGTQCLLDIAKNDGNEAHRWFERLASQGVHVSDLRISACSIALLRFHFDDNPPRTPGDHQLQVNLNRLITRFKNAHAVLGCSMESICYWADNLGDSITYDRPPPRKLIGVEALVLATVATGDPVNPYTLVDRHQTIHQQLNIATFDPY
jgi:hypothetical protein